MNMNNIGESLTRKLGPLPVWVWAVVGGLILYMVRNRQAGGAGNGRVSPVDATKAEAQLVQAEGSARAATMESPSILTDNQRVYDPNTGFLSTNPNTTQNDSLIGLIASLLMPPPAPAATTTPPVKPKVKLTKGAQAAPSGAHKPTGAPPGYHAVGLGHGHWEYAPNKPKPSTKAGGKSGSSRARTHKAVHPDTEDHPGHHQKTTKPKKKK